MNFKKGKVIPKTEVECWNTGAPSAAYSSRWVTVTALLHTWSPRSPCLNDFDQTLAIISNSWLGFYGAVHDGVRPTQIEPNRRNVSAASWPGIQQGKECGRYGTLGRGHRSKSEVWAAPSILCARRQMLCGSAAGGARTGEAAQTASLSFTLTLSLR